MSFFGLGKDLNVEIAGLIADQIARISLGLQGGRVTLGGTSGSGGGTGVPPGGFVGQLIQSYVAYDTDELMSVQTSSGSSALDNLNHIRAWLDPARWLRAQAQNPPDMTLYVRPGIAYFTSGSPPTVFAGGNTPTFTAPGSEAKIDVLYLNDSGSLAIEAGTSGSDPQPSYPTSGSTIPIAEVYIRASSGSLCDTDDGVAGYIYRDVRPFLNLGGAGGDGGGAPTDAEYVVTALHGDLSAELLHSGLSGADLHDTKSHTHTESDISDLDHDALKIQGRDVASTAPAEDQVLAWNNIASQWQPQDQSGSGGSPDGVLVLTARGGSPRTDSGCGEATKEEIGTVNHIDKYVLPFDTASDEYAQWGEIVMPTDWDGGTIQARFVWTSGSGVGGSGETVCLGLRGRSWGDGEAIDQALGTAQFVTDTWIADKYEHTSAASSAITLAGTPAAGELVLFEVQRDVSEDDLGGDAWLISVLIEFGRT